VGRLEGCGDRDYPRPQQGRSRDDLPGPRDPVTPLIAEPTSDLDFAIATVKAQDYRCTSSKPQRCRGGRVPIPSEDATSMKLYIVTDGQAQSLGRLATRRKVWKRPGLRLPLGRALAGEHGTHRGRGAAAAHHGRHRAAIAGDARPTRVRRSRVPSRSNIDDTRWCAARSICRERRLQSHVHHSPHDPRHARAACEHARRSAGGGTMLTSCCSRCGKICPC